MNKINRIPIAQAGFTLVELSIVIVIIGFLVAGVAAGANLVKQAQLRSVISDLRAYQTGYNGFIGRFNAVPGDFASATSYWSGANNCSVSGTSTGDGRCNGDGDGVVEPSATAASEEVSAAWKHMQLAGFVGAGIINIADTISALTPGLDTPSSKISGAGYFISGTSDLTRGATAVSIGFGAGATNYAYVGKPTATAAVLNLVDGALTGEQAYNIDAKLDDGVPGTTAGTFVGFNTGVVRVVKGSSNTTLTCTLGTDVPSTATSYAVAQTATSCMLGIALN